MPYEHYLSFGPNPDEDDTDPDLLLPGERSGIYPEDSSGRQRYFSIGCTKDDKAVVEFFEAVGSLANPPGESIVQHQLPPPSEVIIVGEYETFSRPISSGGMDADLVVRYISPAIAQEIMIESQLLPLQEYDPETVHLN